VLLSREPRLATCEIERTGVHAHEVADVFRPAPGVETGDADESLLSYLDGAEHAWDAYLRAGPPVQFDEDFAAYVYHLPFGGLAERAHLRLCKRELRLDRAAATAHFERKVKASLTHNRRIGSVYGASTFVALLGLIENSPELTGGDRVLVYSYGSGSCAEMYALRLSENARTLAERADVGAMLDARRRVDVATYERCERALSASLCAQEHEPDPDLVPGHYESVYEGRNHLVFRGVRDWRRNYGWS